MDDVGAESIDTTALTENVKLTFFLSDLRLETVFAKDGRYPLGGIMFAIGGDSGRSILLLTEQPFLARVELGVGEVGPCGREAIDRSKPDIQRENKKEEIKIPAMVNIEDAERTEHRFFGGSKRRKVSVETLDVLLHYQHTDHGENDHKAEQNDTKPDGAQKIEYPVNDRFRRRCYRVARLNNFFGSRHFIVK